MFSCSCLDVTLNADAVTVRLTGTAAGTNSG